MKLKLKHLAPYMHCKLEIFRDYGDGEIEISEMLCLDAQNNEVYGENFDTKLNESDDKLILRPLSDLTKEIEHNGEKFVPMFKLFEIEYCGTQHVEGIRNLYTQKMGRFLETSHYGTSATTSINTIALFQNNYWKIKQLIEWHFDVFGLIPNGLAIDKNTL